MSKNTKVGRGPKHWLQEGRSILNGVMGDYLDRENNPLSIKMGFYHQGNRLQLEQSLSSQLGFPLSNKLVVFVHGLTNTEFVWDYSLPPESSSPEFDKSAYQENYGSKLHNDLSYTPFYLRYNTGLSLEKNGKLLETQLSALFRAYPIKIDELVLIGFSMGGLLLRHAQYEAIEINSVWLKALKKCMYLGTPHEGSPLEKFGNLSGEIISRFPKDYVSHWAEWIDIRSEGIKDLRHGLRFLSPTYEEDVSCASFYSDAEHYFISGSVGKQEGSLIEKLIGDTLVRKSSANPSSAPTDSLNAHFENLPHIPLAHSERVYQQIVSWLTVKDGSEQSIRTIVSSQGDLLDGLDECPSVYVDDSDREMLGGAIDLAGSFYKKALDTVETIHSSIADEPYKVLQALPLVNQVAKPVEEVHKGVSSMVFKTLKTGGKLAHKTAKGCVSDE